MLLCELATLIPDQDAAGKLTFTVYLTDLVFNVYAAVSIIMNRTPTRRPGRPRKSDPAATYADRSYVVTTFRLNKKTIAKADALDRELDLGSRTAAIQYAVDQAFEALAQRRGRRVQREMEISLAELTRFDSTSTAKRRR